MKRKFTRGGGAPLVLTVIALIISLAAAFEEYLGRFIYNLAFNKETDKIFVSDITGLFTMERNSVTVIRVYTEKAFIMALVAFIAFVVLAASVRKKKIVSGEAWMMIITSAACAIEPVIYMTYFFSKELYKNFSDSNDGVRFRSFYGFLIYALPLIAACLLIIAGFILLIRLAKEKAVDISGETDDASINDTYTPAVEPPVAQMQPEAVMPEAAMPQNAVYPGFSDVNNEVQSEEKIEIPQAVPAIQTMDTVEVPQEQSSSAPQTEEIEAEPLITHEVQKVFCGNCGQQLDPSAKFCNNCGAKRN